MVDEFVYERDGTEAVLSIKVLRGAFLFVGGKVEEKTNSRVTIDASRGVLGVRGTPSGEGLSTADGVCWCLTAR